MADYGGAASFGSSLGSAAATIFTARANKAVSDMQVQTAEKIRGLNNEVVKVENERDKVISATQRWRQAVANQRVLENAGKDRETIEVNFWRQADARRRGSFSDQIRFAEEEGRMAAAAAMSGVTGSVVDALNTTAALRKGIEDTYRADAENQFNVDKGRLQFSTYWAHLDQVDYSLIFDNTRTLDFNRNVAAPANLLGGINPKDVANIAHFAGDFFKPAPNSLSIYSEDPSDATGNYHELTHE